MLKEFENLPYRPNVSIIIFRDNKFLLVQKPSWEKYWWKFPQGGIDKDEDVLGAGLRELKEEVGISSVKVLGISKYVNTYDWPDPVLKKLKKKKWRGQTQHFVVAEFIGNDDEIKADEKEISIVKWFSKDEVLEFSEKRIGTFSNYNNIIPEVFEEFQL